MKFLSALLRKQRFIGWVAGISMAMATATAQSVTGQLSGSVADSSGGAVAGATVRLIHDLSQTDRGFTSERNGSFIFTGLVPGTYTLKVAMPGFKSYDQKGITVAAQERVDVHEVVLQAVSYTHLTLPTILRV